MAPLRLVAVAALGLASLATTPYAALSAQAAPAAVLATVGLPTRAVGATSRVVANDNRRPAGRLTRGVLTLRLVVGEARWSPEGEDGPSVPVQAFAEEGRAPQIPAPLIRVRTGTTIVATVRNALTDSAVTLHGLQTRPARSDDSVRIPAGESRTIRFAAGAPGTYLYYATTGRVNRDASERETLGGAFAVDAPEARTDDRIFVINIWGQARDSLTYRNALAINGRSWPHTERIAATTGDSVRWRVVNASGREHPMHLHGFYFRVDARGGLLADTLYTPSRRRRVVTEGMDPGTTMRIAWYADRPGNWLLHCHLAFHVVPESRLDPVAPDAHDALAHDADRHMAGLVVGITVRPARGWTEPPRAASRTLRLHVREGPRRGRAPRALGFVLERGAAAPPADSMESVGSTLVLTRGQPTDITVVNHLREPTGVHWHGIELESYSDGVVGWSGEGTRVAPLIAPGDSFTARLTLPRSGTFIYHTHLGDLEQLTSGLYGALVVLPPGDTLDPRTDHVFVAGWDGLEEPPHVVVNGDSIPEPMTMAFGRTHRLRLVSIGPAPPMQFVLRRDTSVVAWRALAKDGADLPRQAAIVRAARQVMTVGETYDFAFVPRARGAYRLAVELPDGRVPWAQRIVVQ